MASYITMEEVPLGGRKTKVWRVVSNEGGIELGQIRWFGRWRGYAFFPHGGMVFEQQCLRDIAAFVEAESRAYRKGWGKARTTGPDGP